MQLDNRPLVELIADSDELQLAALRGAPVAVAELEELRDDRARRDFQRSQADVERFNASRQRLVQRLGIGALTQGGNLSGDLAAALLGALAPPVFADPRGGVEAQVLLSAALLSRIAVAAHRDALLQARVTSGGAALAEIATIGLVHHDQHRLVFERQLLAVGGRLHDGARPAYLPDVPSVPAPALSPTRAAAQLAVVEHVIAETFCSDAPSLGRGRCSGVLVGIADVVMHHAVMLAQAGDVGAADLLGRRRAFTFASAVDSMALAIAG